MKKELSKAQAVALLKAHCLNSWGGHPFSVYRVLLERGYITEIDAHLRVTDKGKRFCDENHMNYQFSVW